MQRKLYATLCASASWPRASPRPPPRRSIVVITTAGTPSAASPSPPIRSCSAYPILIVTAERGDGDPRPSRNVVLR